MRTLDSSSRCERRAGAPRQLLRRSGSAGRALGGSCTAYEVGEDMVCVTLRFAGFFRFWFFPRFPLPFADLRVCQIFGALSNLLAETAKYRSQICCQLKYFARSCLQVKSLLAVAHALLLGPVVPEIDHRRLARRRSSDSEFVGIIFEFVSDGGKAHIGSAEATHRVCRGHTKKGCRRRSTTNVRRWMQATTPEGHAGENRQNQNSTREKHESVRSGTTVLQHGRPRDRRAQP